MTEPNVTPVHDTQRFIDFLEFIAAHHGRWMGTRVELAAALGLTISGLNSVTKRAEDLKVIVVTRHSHPVIGQGKLPNVYKLRVTPDEWRARGHEIVAARTATQDRKRIEKRMAKELAAKQAKRSARQRAALIERREDSAIIAVLVPPGRSIQVAPAPTMRAQDAAVDVGAWADADDF